MLQVAWALTVQKKGGEEDPNGPLCLPCESERRDRGRTAVCAAGRGSRALSNRARTVEDLADKEEEHLKGEGVVGARGGGGACRERVGLRHGLVVLRADGGAEEELGDVIF